MSAETEEILHAIAAGEVEIHARFNELERMFRDRIKEINEKLERALVLVHAIERDVSNPNTTAEKK